MAVHLVMYRGDDRVFPLVITEGGVPVDLTTASAITFTARETLDAEDPLFTLTLADDEIEIPDQTEDPGLINVTVAAGETTGIGADDATVIVFCDVQYVLDGAVRTWPEAEYGQGTLIRLKIRPDVTHA